MFTPFHHRRTATLLSLRSIAFAGMLFAFLTASGCVLAINEDDFDFDHDAVARASFSTTVDLSNQSRLRLEAVNGNVEFFGDPGATSVTVEGEKKVASNTIRDAERRLDDLEVRIDERNDELFIRTIQPRNTEGRNYVINYTITLPTDLEVWIDLTNGNINVVTLDNNASVNNTNGNVRLKDIAGNVTVDLTNGNIECEAALPPGGLIDLTTTNGNIDLAVPASTSAVFSARVTNGTIHASDLNLADVVRTNRSLSGTLRTGDGTIDLRTTNGNISARDF